MCPTGDLPEPLPSCQCSLTPQFPIPQPQQQLRAQPWTWISFFPGSPRPLFFHSSFQNIFCFISLSPLFKGSRSDYSLVSTLFSLLNQDPWAKNRKSCSSSTVLREALVFLGWRGRGSCVSEGSRCINYAAHDCMPPLQSLVSPCL